MKKLLLLTLLLLGFTYMGAQNKTVNLNDVMLKSKESLTNKVIDPDLQKATKRTRTFAVNKVLQSEQNLNLNDTLLLELFSDKLYKAYIDDIETDLNGTLSIRGRMVDYPMGYFIITTSSDKNSLVLVEIPELKEKYISRLNANTKAAYLLELDGTKTTELEGAEPLIPSDEVDNYDSNHNNNVDEEDIIEDNRIYMGADGRKYETKELSLKAATDYWKQIDIMIVYTPAAKQWSDSNDGGINNTIANIMAKAKLALDNSNVKIKLFMANSRQVNYVEYGNSSTDLSRLRNTSDGYMDDVHQWRNQYGVDLVVLLTKVDDVGGIAYRMSSTSGEPTYAFSISRVQQASSSYTTIHEIGHNMGLGHHKQQNSQPGPGIFPYSAGWRWKGNDGNVYCSVMTYYQGSYFSDGITATRVPYFSNPSISYKGYPTGHATNGDAARSLRETKEVVSKYRDLICNAPTGLTITDIGANSVIVKFNAVPGNTNYKVDYKKTSSSTWIGYLGTQVTYDNAISGLEPNTTYQWRVKAECSGYAYGSTFTTKSPSACSYNYEPNNTRATATSISPNVTYNAAISNSTDEDYYKFTVNSTSNIYITLDHRHDMVNYDMELFNSSGTVVGRSQVGYIMKIKSITMNNLSAGTYYVRAYGYGQRDYEQYYCYSLKVGVTATCCNNYEPNETLATARSISTNFTYNAGINSSTDIDYYKFTLSSNEGSTRTVITLRNLPKDYDIRLYNSAGTQIGSSSNGGTADETITKDLPKGTYYVRVHGYNGYYDTSQCYALRVATSIICSDPYEPNETRQTAYAISPNINYRALISSTSDQDYYSIFLSQTSDLTLTLQNLPKDYDLQLLNSSGTVIATSSNAGTTSETMTKTNLAAGTYYIRVYGFSGNYDINNCYILKAMVLIRNTTKADEEADAAGISVNEEDNAWNVIIYPNPVKNILNVEGIVSDKENNIQVNIVNSTGIIVKKIIVEANEYITKIDVSDLPSGVYLLNVLNKNYKFIKE